MHILIFYVFFTLLSLSHLQGKTQNDGYNIKLIHRYSPNSPYYNSSMTIEEVVQRLALHSGSRHRRLNDNFENLEFETNIIPSDGDYLMKIAIGNPPVDIYAVADTGSDLIWVQCKNCDVCYPQIRPMFDPKKSKSYKTLPCNSTFCTSNLNSECDYTSDECEYYYAYGTGSTVSVGIMAVDLFKIADTYTSCVFGCGLVQDGGFDNNAGGLVGFGGGKLSLISQLGPTIANKFSYCLTPISSNRTSRLRLGSTQTTTASTPAVVTPLVDRDNPTYYTINLKNISIGQTELQVNNYIIIDSGSTLTYIAASVYSRLEEIVKQNITAEPMKNPPQELSLCYVKTPQFEANFTIDFMFDGGELKLADVNYLIDFGDYICLAIVPSDEDDDPMILGNVAQVNLEVEIDITEKTVSFTPTDCTQDHI